MRTSQTVFDVTNESDVITLLRTIHQNPIDEILKNHIRDLIFSYRQSQNNGDLQELIILFGSMGITVQAGKVDTPNNANPALSNTEHVSFSFGNKRPVPKFSSSTPTQTPSVPTPVKEVVVAEPLTPVAPSVTEIPLSAPLHVVDVQVAQKEVQAEVSIPVATVTSTPAQPSTVPPLERIAEIKRSVNEKVGNPVNLIDANNEVGREYMNALLDAMKKTNGGQPQEVIAAMERLEKSYIAVQAVIKNGLSQTPPAASEPILKSEPKPVQQTASQVTPQSVTPAPQEPVATAINPVKLTVIETPVTPMREVSSFGAAVQEKPVQTQTQVPVSSAMHSVAKEKQLQELVRNNRAQEIEKSQREAQVQPQSSDPLESPEVTSGLGQLLSEWSLFKSSGIFGTGPSGKDHTLYLKLAPLTMAAVIAGRFEGATPKIKQSIADYMNGWRYEEGIMHEHAETFEHYLRRVIYHILNKRKVSK